MEGLFERLPKGDHELVLFDINRMAEIEPILGWDPGAVVQALRDDPDRAFTLSLVTNANTKGRGVVLRSKQPGENAISEKELGLSWPEGLYSLAHVALPFPPQDPLYGGRPEVKSPGIRLGAMALRGERGVLQIPASEMLRLRWNPFYPYVEERVLEFLGLTSVRYTARGQL